MDTLSGVARDVKPVPRAYNAAGRRSAAQRRRRAVLAAAGALFVDRGYLATTMADIAAEAGVALDTVYALVGRKPDLFRLLVESAISGTDAPVPADEREYVRAVRAEADAGRKLELYAQAMRQIHARLAPLLKVLSAAAAADPGLAEVWTGIANRRAANMRMLVAEIAAIGALRDDLSVDQAADVVWAMNSPEFYILLVDERGWTPDQYAEWLGSAWRQLLLKP